MRLDTALTADLAAALARLLGEDPAELRHPYPLFAQLREFGPVFVFKGQVVVVGHAAVCEVLRDATRFVTRPLRDERPSDRLRLLSQAARRRYQGVDNLARLFMSRQDGDSHARLRHAVSASVDGPVLGFLEEVARASWREVVGKWAPGRPTDAMVLADRQSTVVTAALLGIPQGDVAATTRCLREIENARRSAVVEPDIADRAIDGLEDLRLRTAEAVWGGRPGDRPTVARALRAGHGAGVLSRDEVIATMALMVLASLDTSRALIGNAILALARNTVPVFVATTSAEASRRAVAEVLRYDPPVQVTARWAAAEAVVGGCRVPVGTRLWLLLGAANRDPRCADDGDKFDLHRPVTRSLSLGWGTHHCLGGPVARLHVRVALEELTRRHLRLAPGVSTESVRWAGGITMRCPVSMPVVVET
jgi:cytochrome P450